MVKIERIVKTQEVLKIMDQTTYLILQCGAPFIYKPAYFRLTGQLSPNTWNFIVMQNKINRGCIGLTKNMNTDRTKNSVKLSGQGPIDYSKLSKRQKRRVTTSRVLLCDLSLNCQEDEEKLFNWLENRMASLH